jgi:hypothetical protein
MKDIAGPNYREHKSINRKHNFKILLDSVEDYARQWAKREQEDSETPFEWVKNVRSIMQIRIKKLSGFMSTRSTSIFKDLNVVADQAIQCCLKGHLCNLGIQ